MTSTALLLALLAQGPETNRDDAIFGAEEPIDAPERDGAPEETERRMLDRLAETEDPLVIGGFLFQRVEGAHAEGQDLGETRVDAPALVDVYLDARPDDRVRAYVRTRIRHDPTQRAASPAFDLDQLWVKLDVARRVFATVGRQHIKWGVGRIWNPTDFLMDARDPLALFDERLGKTFVKLHLPWEALGWNLYAVGQLDGVERLDEAGGALRAEVVLGPAEVAVTGQRQGEDGPWKGGVDLSTALGALDVRFEAATDSDSEEVRAVGGAEWSFKYSDEDRVSLGGEYFHNPLPEPWNPLYSSERYAAAFVLLPAPGNWNDTVVFANAIVDLDERSWLARLDWQVRVLTYLNLNVFALRGEFADTVFLQAGTGVRLNL